MIPGINRFVNCFAGAVDLPFVTVQFLAQVYAAAGNVYPVAF